MNEKQILIEMKKINAIHFKGLDGINCGNVLYVPIQYMDSRSPTIKYVMSILKNTFFRRMTGIYEGNDIAFLFSSTYANRSDHKRIFDKAAHLYKKKTLFLPKFTVTFHNLKYFFYVFTWFFCLKKIYSSDIAIYFVRHLYAAYIDAIYIFLFMERYDIGCLVTLCDGHMTDGLITQICKLNHITTATMQHGFYDKKCLTINVSQSDYFLGFGQYSYDLARDAEYDISKFRKVGMPHLINESISDQIIVKDTKCFSIVSSGCIEDDEKLLLLTEKLVLKDGYRRIIKLHSGVNIKSYQYRWLPDDLVIMEEKNIYDLINVTDFSIITGGSTVFIEYIVKLFPALLFINKWDYYENIEWFKVRDITEIDNFIFELNHNAQNIRKKMINIREYFTEIQDVSKKYINVYQEMIKEHREQQK